MRILLFPLSQILLVVLIIQLLNPTLGFQLLVSPRRFRRHATPINMGKGFNSAKNRQAELAKKMAEAKQQNKGDGASSTASPSKDNTLPDTNVDTKLAQSHAEFDELLAKNLPPKEKKVVMTETERPVVVVEKRRPPTSTGPKVKAKDLKKKRKKEAAKKNEADNEDDEKAQLREGDKARRRDFEALLEADSQRPLGPMKAAQLVPWVPPFLTDYLVVVADPRRQSNEARAAIQYLESSDVEHVIAVTADDSPSDLLAWKKRVGITEGDGSIQIFTDPSLEWMRNYSCIDDDHWSLHILVIDSDGIIRQHSEKVDPSHACQMVSEMIKVIEA